MVWSLRASRGSLVAGLGSPGSKEVLERQRAVGDNPSTVQTTASNNSNSTHTSLKEDELSLASTQQQVCVWREREAWGESARARSMGATPPQRAGERARTDRGLHVSTRVLRRCVRSESGERVSRVVRLWCAGRAARCTLRGSTLCGGGGAGERASPTSRVLSLPLSLAVPTRRRRDVSTRRLYPTPRPFLSPPMAIRSKYGWIRPRALSLLSLYSLSTLSTLSTLSRLSLSP